MKIDSISITDDARIMPSDKKIVASKTDVIGFVLTIVLTFALFYPIVAGWHAEFMIFTPVYLGIFALATVYIVSKIKKFPKSAILPGLLCVLNSFIYFIHGEETVIISFPLLIVLSGIYCVNLTGVNRNKNGSWFYLIDVLYAEFIIPIIKIFESVSTVFRYNSKEKKSVTKKKSLKWVLLGILISIPALLIIVPLLIGGDLAFSNLMGNGLAELKTFFETFWDKYFISFDTIFLTCLLTFFFAPYIFSVMFCFRNGTSKTILDKSAKYVKLRKAPDSLLTTFLSVISAVYVVYLLSQFSYFFAAFSGHLPGGKAITIAEYARSGFFELIKIAIINFIIVWAVSLFAKRNDNKFIIAHKILCIFLCVFTIIVTSTSVAKILLYINNFGLTQKRMYALFADIVLISVFVSLIFRLLTNKAGYMNIIIYSASIAVIFLGLLGVSTTVNNYNCKAYLDGKINSISFDSGVLSYNLDIEQVLKIRDSSDTSKKIAEETVLKYEASSILYAWIDWIMDNDVALAKKYAADTNPSAQSKAEYSKHILNYYRDVYVMPSCFFDFSYKNKVIDNWDEFSKYLEEYMIGVEGREYLNEFLD